LGRARTIRFEVHDGKQLAFAVAGRRKLNDHAGSEVASSTV